jgi:hypothetical protein
VIPWSVVFERSMSCMCFPLSQRPRDDSTESSDSITYWRKPLASPPAKSEAAEEQDYDHDDEDEYKHCLSMRAADHERRSATGRNF